MTIRQFFLNLTFLIKYHFDRHEFEDSLLDFTNVYWIVQPYESHIAIKTQVMLSVPIGKTLALHFVNISTTPMGVAFMDVVFWRPYFNYERNRDKFTNDDFNALAPTRRANQAAAAEVFR